MMSHFGNKKCDCGMRIWMKTYESSSITKNKAQNEVNKNVILECEYG